MQHLTSVRYASCTASLVLEDKASCALAAKVSGVKLHTLPPFAARAKDVHQTSLKRHQGGVYGSDSPGQGRQSTGHA